FSEAQAKWPGLSVTQERFEQFLAERGAVDGLHTSDLFLACACLDGDSSAIATFDAAFIAPLRSPVGRVKIDSSMLDELKQVLRRKLLMSEPDRPAKIASYSGNGPLQAWVRVSAVRSALNLIDARKGPNAPSAQVLDEDRLLDASTHDPELVYIKRVYREAF